MAMHPTIPDATIRALLSKARNGESSAIEALYDLYADRLYRYLFARTGDAQVAEDLTADVFLRAYKHIGNFRLSDNHPASSVSAWLYRIAGNLVTDYWRASRHRQHDCLDDHEGLPARAQGPEEAVEQGERSAVLTEALNKLTDEQRVAVVCRFLEGMNNRQVAECLGKSEGAVEQLLHRALRRLGRLLCPQAATPGTRSIIGHERVA